MLVLIIYFIISFIEIVGEFTENYTLLFYSKILLMPTLMLFVFKEQKIKGKVIFLLLGLLFSWFGDIFLVVRHHQVIENKKLFFIFGLAAFLVAHIQYIIAFTKDTMNKKIAGYVISKPYLVLPFIIFVATLWLFLGNHIHEVKLPIYLYSIIIATMSITALNRKKIVDNSSFRLVFIGALLFMFSDTCIAVSVFKQPFYLDRVMIMSTYVIAQYLIVKGYLANIKIAN